MKWSARLGRFAGIDVYVHVTFLLLLAWFAFVSWNETGTLAGVLTGLSLILLLFLCVVLHEYGHALTARRFGIGTRSITILPIGGLALLDSMPKDPRQEILVALAGPAVNLLIAATLWLGLAVAGRAGALTGTDLAGGAILPTLLAANLLLAVFNMLPAFPMDGGRVLRAVLSFRMDRVRATRLAARIGQALAILLGFLGLTGNPFLVLIAVFVWIGAGAEAGAVEAEARLAHQPAGRAMITDFQTIAPWHKLSRAIDLTLAGTQKDFPIVEDGRIAGVLTQAAILRGLRDLGPDGLVSEVAAPVETADVSTSLAVLLENLRAKDARLVCITRGGLLAGIVDLDNITEYLRIQAALEAH
ncbi:MAG TPA: site-2 protease family protein [Amaricoccus sp.]|uniref:site-2 protease family protein n=1 Tax=Amaricoccus sp. TaxID=1872485 RepID=UPI002B59DE88|nr:site-2 protease family protein [Amaricoccus sp.]HMQ94920.1 site-2 protease family protein [Amaricoccus sp.]HMR53705.1 site-2 protease family protein [Amaricoccus sp.]HMR59769.1 site-2 protease family protein [Amaricoccus sp.]HMT98954.1 site-2 protease family protein [Amaricoccus sp.]